MAVLGKIPYLRVCQGAQLLGVAAWKRKKLQREVLLRGYPGEDRWIDKRLVPVTLVGLGPTASVTKHAAGVKHLQYHKFY